MDYSGIHHNTGCSGFSFGVKLKDFGYNVEPLSFTSYICHYKWYYSCLLIAGVSIKKGEAS
jgi:hypothetical protein